MKVIVVTGGIASGKSTVVNLLREIGGNGLQVFDCDKAVEELQQSGKLSRDLVTAFGADALNEDGSVNKELLRNIVQHNPEGRLKLNAIVHPKVAQLCKQAQLEARHSELVHTFLVDIPLYFESPADFGADRVCLVAVTPETQIKRMAERDGLDRAAAEAMIAAQMPTQEKIEKSGTVFWNEGSMEMLRAQVKYFFESKLAKDAEVVNQRAKVVSMNELRAIPLNDLRKLAEENIKKSSTGKNRHELVQELCRTFAKLGNRVFVTGVLDANKDGTTVLRDEQRSYRHEIDDIAIPNELVKRYSLRPGNKIKVRLSQEQSTKAGKPLRAGEVEEVEGTPAAEYKAPKEFDKLTPLFPRERIILENPDLKIPSMRVLDLITPVGMGQRALVVAPPRGGKTVLLKSMAKSIRANYPDAELLILLLDERPEEVTDFEESVNAPVLASTFDESSRRHAELSDMVLERARRLVERGKNVIIMLDSLTRLARGYNANQSGGRIMSGGLGSNALEKPRKFFGAARNVEEGGSLTIIATCLVDTESRMDEIIFEEFKGTGNMEIRLDRELAERRIYPAISVPQSGTRNDDRLYHPDEFSRILQLRRQLASHPGWEALELLLRNIRRTQNNAELLISGLVDKK